MTRYSGNMSDSNLRNRSNTWFARQSHIKASVIQLTKRWCSIIAGGEPEELFPGWSVRNGTFDGTTLTATSNHGAVYFAFDEELQIGTTLHITGAVTNTDVNGGEMQVEFTAVADGSGAASDVVLASQNADFSVDQDFELTAAANSFRIRLSASGATTDPGTWSLTVPF